MLPAITPIAISTKEIPTPVGVHQIAGELLKSIDQRVQKIDALEFNIAESEKTSAALNKDIENCNDTQLKEQKGKALAETLANIGQLRNRWNEECHTAFAAIIDQVKSAGLDPSHMPPPVALRLAALLTRYGIHSYGKPHLLEEGLVWKDQSQAHKYLVAFWRPLLILEAGLTLHAYALSQADHYPDFTQARDLHDLFRTEELKKATLSQTEHLISSMTPAVWSQKSELLSQAELIVLTKCLRYINGAIRYLGHVNNQPGAQGTLAAQENLLMTAETLLIQGKRNPNFEIKVINNELAELKYNDISGLLSRKRDELKDEAGEWKRKLETLWDDCVNLSADPEAMAARCKNKRAFDESLTIDEELSLRKQALADHRALPAERKIPVLIAIALGNLGHVYLRKSLPEEARPLYQEAMEIVCQCQAKGENNIQFAGIEKNYQALFTT